MGTSMLLYRRSDARKLLGDMKNDLKTWADLSVVLGSFSVSPGSFLASDRPYSSIEVLMKSTVLFFRQARSDIGVHRFHVA